MKLSVIMGIVHMTIGVLMKGTNAVFRKDWPTLIFEVITGLTMLLGLFGWMDLLIFGKWFFPLNFNSRVVQSVGGVSEYEGDLYNRLVPSVINIMITTVFSGGVPSGPTQYAFLVSGVMEMKGKPFNEVYPPSLDQ
jgi:vacuolar-type H+-ATPase subunit I/STV1